MEFTSAGLHQMMKMTFKQPSSVLLDPACPLSPLRSGFNLWWIMVEEMEGDDGMFRLSLQKFQSGWMVSHPSSIPSTLLNPLAQVTQEG